LTHNKTYLALEIYIMSNKLYTVGTCIFIVVVLVGFGVYWHRRYSDDGDTDPYLGQVRKNFAMINPEFGKIPLQTSRSESYTDNKRLIVLCIQDPDTHEYYSMNTIMYVALHELAHVVTKNWDLGEDHGAEFRANFDKLLKRGEELGFYNSRIPIPPTYCNL
jgi:hypothetical protein